MTGVGSGYNAAVRCGWWAVIAFVAVRLERDGWLYQRHITRMTPLISPAAAFSSWQLIIYNLMTSINIINQTVVSNVSYVSEVM